MHKIAFTGDGKGKTTGSVAILIGHATGHRPCLFIQFLKGGRFTGELLLLEKHFPKVTTLQLGKHSIFSENIKEGKRAPGMECFVEVKGYKHSMKRDVMKLCREKLVSRSYSIVVFDELITAYWIKSISLSEIEELISLAQRTGASELVATGRGMTPALAKRFNEVIEYRLVKHPFSDTGLVGRYGIEY